MDIQHNKETVENCLKKSTYYVDFYQRNYVWKETDVKILIEDIFDRFLPAYKDHKDKDINKENLAKYYNWYYLNIYITNLIDSKKYIVDGQQRLTTLTLIALKLYHLAQKNKDDKKFVGTLKDCIYGEDKYDGEQFNIDNEKRKSIMQCLLEGKETPTQFENITSENIYHRYKNISEELDKRIGGDSTKLHAFTAFFLDRIVLVELEIKQNDTPMVFEVINDRGKALQPFEILKGKLIGVLDKSDTEKYNEIWEDALGKLKGIENDFFIDYLKAKFIYKRSSEKEAVINNTYHKYIFENNSIADTLRFRKKDENNVQNIKKFIKDDLNYYATLYAEIRKNKTSYLKYNNEINQLNGQYQNILASCEINDSQEQEKIEIIAKEIDRLYVLLQLNRVYDSNNFQEIIYALNENLKDTDTENYRAMFNRKIVERIKEQRNITSLNDLLEYSHFLNCGYDNLKVSSLRYLFSRIEQYICKQINENMRNNIEYISTKTGHKNGYHIEHILSYNEENKNLFETEEEFENKRNRLGGLLLLKGKNNISSGNEKYIDKLRTYSSTLIWNETLIQDFYKSNKDFEKFNNDLETKIGMKFKPIETFNEEALEDRGRLLHSLIKIIWEVTPDKLNNITQIEEQKVAIEQE